MAPTPDHGLGQRGDEFFTCIGLGDQRGAWKQPCSLLRCAQTSGEDEWYPLTYEPACEIQCGDARQAQIDDSGIETQRAHGDKLVEAAADRDLGGSVVTAQLFQIHRDEELVFQHQDVQSVQRHVGQVFTPRQRTFLARGMEGCHLSLTSPDRLVLDSLPETAFHQPETWNPGRHPAFAGDTRRSIDMATTTGGKTGRMEGTKAADAGQTRVGATPTEDMEIQIRALKEEIAKLRAQISSSGGRSYDAIRNIASDGAEQLRMQGEETIEGLRESARDIEAQMSAHVREKPVTSLAIAAGIGFLFALIARR